MPERIQLSRAKGWRMPPNTKKVDRSTPWGNPFWVERRSGKRWNPGTAAWGEIWEVRHYDYMWGPTFPTKPAAAAHAAEMFRQKEAAKFDLSALRGKNLACWCPLDQPCHADVLLEIANGR